MSALPKVQLTPDEQFIMQAVQDGRAKQMNVSMKAIGIPDVGLQARVVHLDMGHCCRLDKARQLTGSLSPIVLFRGYKDDKLYLADGHHRHHVYRNAGLPAIPAWVIDSSNPELEALEFATMCNREMCLGRTNEDIERAIRMLLEKESWWRRSDPWIGDHVGCSVAKVGRVRIDFSRRMGREIPSHFDGRDERQHPYRYSKRDFSDPPGIKLTIRKRRDAKTQYYEIKHNRKVFYLGTNEEKARERLADLDFQITERRKSLEGNSIRDMMKRLGFDSVIDSGKTKMFPGVNGWHRDGILGVVCNFSSKDRLPLAVGNAECAADILMEARGKLTACRYKKELGARLIIICYPDDGPFYLMELYKAAGFEFMTPTGFREAFDPAKK